MKFESIKNGGKLLARQILLVLFDIVLFSFASFFSLWLRFEFDYKELAQTEYLLNALRA